MLYDTKWNERLTEILDPKKQAQKPAVSYPKTAQQAILAAAKIIQEKGWVKWEFSDRNGYCFVGALNKALGRRPSNTNWEGGKNRTVAVAALRKINTYLGDKNRSTCELEGLITSFNDGQCCDQKEAVSFLRKAARS